MTTLCRVIIKKQQKQSYLPKLFKILLHIFHYCIGWQATHKYFLCSCDHLERKGREERISDEASNASHNTFNEASNTLSEQHLWWGQYKRVRTHCCSTGIKQVHTIKFQKTLCFNSSIIARSQMLKVLAGKKILLAQKKSCSVNFFPLTMTFQIESLIKNRLSQN